MPLRPLIFSLLTFLAASSADGEELAGRWLTASGNIEVEIARCGPALCGTVVRVLSDRSMADSSVVMTDAPGVGIIVLSNFLPAADAAGSFEGYLYNRENRKTYASVMTLEAPDRLSVLGYVGIRAIGQTQIWTRVADSAAVR